MTQEEVRPAATPDDLLKAAVHGTADQPAEAVRAQPDATIPPEVRTPEVKALEVKTLADVETLAKVETASPVVEGFRRTLRGMRSGGTLHRFAVPAGSLVLGAVLGGLVTGLARPATVPGDAMAALGTTLDAGRTETARLGTDIAQLHRVVADLRTATETARKEAATRGTALTERMGQLDKALAAKTATLGDRLEQAEREQNARIAGLATQLDRRVTPSASAAKPEPTQTGSLADTRSAEAKSSDSKAADAKAAEVRTNDPKRVTEKPPVIEGWALRDVFDGTAILENRRRRLVEVAPGDTIPGIGRVEGVERRGREWVVVTRVGLVTPQAW